MLASITIDKAVLLVYCSTLEATLSAFDSACCATVRCTNQALLTVMRVFKHLKLAGTITWMLCTE